MRTSPTSLQTELWTSWASLLRSYAAAHGLNAPQHAVIEVSPDSITLRVGPRWLRFTHSLVEQDDKPARAFRLNDTGTVSLADQPPEEMDVVAERFAREMLTAPL